MRVRLDRLEAPGEREAGERAWEVVRAAYAEREPADAPRSPVRWRPLAVLVAAAAVAAAALSPPGDALLDSVREAIGVEDAEVALFSLPASGRVLATSPEGAWVVSADGSKRLLGPYREASWSPFGAFVVAVRPNELAALEPDGDVRWTLARRGVALARWGGSHTDTRIAYWSGSTLRVVAGDGTGDRLLARRAARVAPAWRPGARHVLAYVAGGRLVVADVDSGRTILTRRAREPVALAWAPDGRRLALVTRRDVLVLRPGGEATVVRTTGAVDAAFSPDGRLALLLPGSVRVGTRVVFAGPGPFSGIEWSPDGRWLLVAWPAADQWLFVRGGDVEAAANVSEQFGGFAVPGGWCCADRAPAAEAAPARALAAVARRAAPAVAWRESTALGRPDAGGLVDGVELPVESPTFFTWHPVERRSPNPRWRRYGTDDVVRTVLRILDEFAAAHPGAPRVGVGDLSRPAGGPFGPKHASHQNGLDVDVYFPRRDGRERPPDRPGQLDRGLAQDLVDRFVAAGAVRVFVGPRTGLRGPPDVVQVLANHDNHLHARFPRR